MKILIVNNSKIPALQYGGTERVIWWLGKALVNMGHEVTYLVSKGSECPFAKVLFLQEEKPIATQIPDNIDIVHLNFFSKEHFSKPVITTIHGNSNDPDRLYHINTVFVSKNHAKRNGSSAFVYNGLGLEDYGKPDINRKRNYFHFLGNAAWRIKNVKGAIRLALATSNKLHVIGGNRLNFKMGFRFTLNPAITFHGMTGGQKKNEILNNSKGLIFPVLWHEPFGIAITESLYFGCPVFGTPYGSLPELIAPEVGFVSNSFTELATKIREVDSFSRKTCHEYVCDRFNASKMAEDYMRYYEAVLNGEQINLAQPKPVDLPQPKFLSFYE